MVRVGFEPTIAQLKRQRVYEVALLTNHARNVESQTYLHINYSFNKMYGQIYLYNLNQLRLKLCRLTIYLKSSTTFLFQAYESTLYKVSFTLPYFSDWAD